MVNKVDNFLYPLRSYVYGTGLSFYTISRASVGQAGSQIKVV